LNGTVLESLPLHRVLKMTRVSKRKLLPFTVKRNCGSPTTVLAGEIELTNGRGVQNTPHDKEHRAKAAMPKARTTRLEEKAGITPPPIAT
jgi:hypothetical protein